MKLRIDYYQDGFFSGIFTVPDWWIEEPEVARREMVHNMISNISKSNHTIQVIICKIIEEPENAPR